MQIQRSSCNPVTCRAQSAESYTVTDRTMLKRYAKRAQYDRNVVHAILDEVWSLVLEWLPAVPQIAPYAILRLSPRIQAAHLTSAAVLAGICLPHRFCRRWAALCDTHRLCKGWRAPVLPWLCGIPDVKGFGVWSRFVCTGLICSAHLLMCQQPLAK